MRKIDDAKIRTAAHMVDIKSDVLYQYAQELRETLEDLKIECEYADPVKDRELDLFLLELSRSVIALQSLADLRESAMAMQKFRLHAAEELRSPNVGAVLAACPS